MKKLDQFQSTRTGCHTGVMCLVLLALVFGAGQAAANLTAQSSSGLVEVLLAGEQTWQSLTASMTLNVGDQVRTGPNSTVDLWFEDGSVLNLAESTQLTISELNISTAQKTRVARFKLWWGTVTVKITKLAFTQNECEIETETAVASVAFAEMTVTHPQNAPQSEIIARQGQVTVRRLADENRAVNLVGHLSDLEGIEFLLPPAVGAEVFLSVQKILGTIEVQSSAPISDIRPLFDASNNFIKVDNESLNQATISVEEMVSLLEAQSSATIGIPQDQDMLVSVMENTDLVFSIKRRTAAILCEGLYIFLNGGGLQVNNEDVNPGVPNCFPLIAQEQPGEGRSRALMQPELQADTGDTGEQPVVPDAPQSQSSQTAETEEPTPTPMPTATPEEEEEEEEEEEPTPTPTPTEIPEEDTPRPRPPQCPTCPPPPPTATPASPIMP